MVPSPKELDQQNTIFLDGWLDLDSERLREIDDNPTLTRKFLKIGMEEGLLFYDSDGRIWGKGEKEGHFFPYHLEAPGKKKFGIRVSKKAAN